MTYQTVEMTDKENGYEFSKPIRAETMEDAIETAKEEFPGCENFRPGAENRNH